MKEQNFELHQKKINNLFIKRLNEYTLNRSNETIKRYKDRFFIQGIDNWLEITYVIDTINPAGFSFFKITDDSLIKKLNALPLYQPIIKEK